LLVADNFFSEPAQRLSEQDMKKTFILLFSLLPSLIYSQITVADGTDIGADIDSQESTTMYVGAFYAPTTIWDDYSGYVKHYQIMLVLEEGTEGSVILFTFMMKISQEDHIRSSNRVRPITWM
jgi:hypothetical protein